jgi:hypothetical protein
MSNPPLVRHRRDTHVNNYRKTVALPDDRGVGLASAVIDPGAGEEASAKPQHTELPSLFLLAPGSALSLAVWPGRRVDTSTAVRADSALVAIVVIRSAERRKRLPNPVPT